MSENEISVDYLDRITPIKKAPTYNEFISLLVSKFYLTPKMKDKMELVYIDEEDEEVFIDDINYDQFTKEAKKVILNIPESNKSNQNININEAKKKMQLSLEAMQEQIKDYKKKLSDSCEKNIIKKLEEIDEQHKQELSNLKKLYEDKLNKYKNEIEEKTTKVLAEISDKSFQIMVDKLTEYGTNIEQKMENLIEDKKNSLDQKIKEKEDNFDALEQRQKEVSEALSKKIEELKNK